ncbi:MAG TPA: cytochrome c [Rectinemataceae bacterium]|nr:cytochrome c [Rectinemataceae bacterium]
MGLALLSIAAIAAQGSRIPKTLEFSRIPAVFAAYCQACHEWAGSYEGIMGSGLVVPGRPEESKAWLMVAEGRMPAAGPRPSEEEKALIRDWIGAGAPRPSEAGPSPGKAGPAEGQAQARFLGFPNKLAFHRFSGWMSGGLLLAAGAIGAVHAYDMMTKAHDFRDANGITEETMSGVCDQEIRDVWSSPAQRRLGWTHAGLVAAGESFYIANAVTGIGYIGGEGPGLSKRRLHLYAFIAHGSLMAAEVVMGFLTSSALSRGDHDTVSSLGVAHAAVGLAIPIVILSAGAIMGE